MFFPWILIQQIKKYIQSLASYKSEIFQFLLDFLRKIFFIVTCFHFLSIRFIYKNCIFLSFSLVLCWGRIIVQKKFVFVYFISLYISQTFECFQKSVNLNVKLNKYLMWKYWKWSVDRQGANDARKSIRAHSLFLFRKQDY